MNEGHGANVTDCSVEIADVTGHSDAQISQEEQVDQEKPARSFLQHLRIPTPRLTSSSSRSKGNDKELTKRKAPHENRPRRLGDRKRPFLAAKAARGMLASSCDDLRL